ncbi:hypothetical protein PG990_014858 [Apiospora arundinis]
MGLPDSSNVVHCMKRSKWAIVAWLAILRAGHVCVPLDPSTPQNRVCDVVNQVDARLVICDDHLEEMVKTIVETAMTPDIANSTKNDGGLSKQRDKSMDEERLAVITHTSGSSGKPKAVMQSHAAIMRSLLHVSKALEVDDTTRFLQFASYSFDASICEIFVPLIMGACVCIPDAKDPLQNLAEGMRQLRVNAAEMTPSVANTLSPDEVPGLKRLALGGERASIELLKKWSSVKLKVVYGTAETRVWDSICVVQRESPSSTKIGHPIGGPMWVVHPDNWEHLSPIDAPGELCVQGPDIALGYLNQPELTAAKFKQNVKWLASPNPHDACNASTIYRTGDLARVLRDGSFQLLGRCDRQLKIRGQRLEPAEVESHLKGQLPDDLEPHTDVIEAHGSQHLTLFLTDNSGDQAEIKDLSRDSEIHDALEYLKTRLPSYFVPSVIIAVTAFPRTHTGKIDRQRLLELGRKFLDDRANAAVSEKHSETVPQDEISKSISGAVGDYISTKFGADVKDLERRDLDISSIGLTSVDAPVLADKVHRASKAEVPASAFLKDKVMLSDILQYGKAEGISSSSEGPDRLQEDVAFWQGKIDSIGPRKTVFLTGGTGYLGNEILRQILTLRAPSHVILLKNGWWQASFRDRLDVWLGDLSQERLGLDQKKWQLLFGDHSRSSTVDLIIHNGAKVDWLADYDSLRETNVQSMFEILRGVQGREIPPQVIYISGGYMSCSQAGPESMEDVATMPAYDWTKFVCDMMIDHFNKQMPSDKQRVSILKPGYIIGSPDTGKSQTGDALWRLVKACVMVGHYSESDAQSWIPVAGVDAIASLALSPFTTTDRVLRRGQTLRIVDGVHLQTVWNTLRELDITVSPMKHEEWVELMQQDIEDRSDEHPLSPLLSWFHNSGGMLGGEPPKPDQLLGGEVRAENSMKRSVEYLNEIGYFKF